MINSYDFGVIVIDGRRYKRDVIIFQNKILDGWWRKQGHYLQLDDLKKVLDARPKPEILVVGTGYSGIMKVSDEVKERLKRKNIEVVAQPTKQACQTFNELLKSRQRIAAALHLTC